MIRCRLTFKGFFNVYRYQADGQPIPEWEASKHRPIDEVATYLPDTGDGTIKSVVVNFGAVYTPDPESANFKWSTATPHAELNMTIGNVHAIRNLVEMAQASEKDGRKNNGKFPTFEFYVDIYPAPAED